MELQTLVDDFIADVKGILADGGASDANLARVRQRMSRLVTDYSPYAPDDEVTGNVHAGRQSRPLYTDDTGLTLVKARFGPEKLTPIHNHGTWGVLGVYKGRDRHQVWRRLDSGTGEGEARIELAAEEYLDVGDTGLIPHPPQDIHAQQGADGKPCFEFVLFGQNAMVIPRLYFDPQARTARLNQLAAIR